MSMLGEIERHAAADLGVLRFITAGSVDDGKSTLIGRLLHDSRAILSDQLAAVTRASQRRGQAAADLSLLTDGLEAEREQGITIDVAYRYFSTGRRKFIIADTPGHEQYTRNMATGASTADAAVVLVDARKGVLRQTRRHASIAHLLGVRHLVFAINKMDLVGDDAAVFERIRSDIEAFLPRLGVSGAHFVPISALRGDMVVERGDALGWYAGPTLLELLESLPVGSELDELPLRLPVQLVIREGAGADFRGYAGRIEAGTLGVGDEVLALPSGRRTRVREIRQLDRRIARARSGDSVLITLADELDVSRGDLFADPADPPIQGQRLWATVCWLDDAPLQPQAAYLLKQTTRTVRARIDSIAERLDVNTLDKVPADSAAVNDIVGLSLKTAQPLIHDDYARIRATGAFILIDEATHRTVAAGMIRG